MIKVDEALDIVLASLKVPEVETVKLLQALRRILAEDVYTGFDIPGFDNSAMDGYALRSSDTTGATEANPKVLEIIEAIKAGFLPSKIISQNQATKIMTGAPIPKGADSVVKVEDTQGEGKNRVKIFAQVKNELNVRRSGEDFKKGELALSKGTMITPACLGILASIGKSNLRVFKKPRVAILATGDEIVDVGDAFAKGKIRSSNTYTLYSQIIESGALPKNLGIVSDDPYQLRMKIEEGLDCDMILTSGGVSMGEYDFVKVVLEEMGADIKFCKVAMRPGKPLIFGLIDGKPIFGLPGNPVSSMIGFEVFVKPAIFKMLGRANWDKKEVEALLEEDVQKKKGLKYFLRAQTRWENGVYRTHQAGPQGSGILKSMAIANSLMILPQDQEFLGKGTKVKVRFL